MHPKRHTKVFSRQEARTMRSRVSSDACLWQMYHMLKRIQWTERVERSFCFVAPAPRETCHFTTFWAMKWMQRLGHTCAFLRSPGEPAKLSFAGPFSTLKNQINLELKRNGPFVLRNLSHWKIPPKNCFTGPLKHKSTCTPRRTNPKKCWAGRTKAVSTILKHWSWPLKLLLLKRQYLVFHHPRWNRPEPVNDCKHHLAWFQNRKHLESKDTQKALADLPAQMSRIGKTQIENERCGLCHRLNHSTRKRPIYWLEYAIQTRKPFSFSAF